MPGVGLTEFGVLSYNGYTFEKASNVSCRSTTVYDEAGRAAVGLQTEVTVRTIIAAGNLPTTDREMEVIRKRLGDPGRVFRMTFRGFGEDITVGPGAFWEDIDGGPFPEVVSWVPIGSNQAAEVTWVIRFTTPLCGPGLKAKRKGVKAINYDVTYRIDEHGDTTRIISGYIAIAVNFRRKYPSDTADAYRDKFVVNLPEGFKRQQEWRLNKKKDRVDFTITDTQIPSKRPWPRCVTAIQASHQMVHRRGTTRGSTVMTRHNISMTVSLKAGFSPAQAWNIFANVVSARLLWARTRNMNPFIESISAEENIYGRDSSFSVIYRYMSPVDKLIANSGLWQPVSGDTDWRRWRSSMLSGQDAPYGERGNAQLRNVASQDVIVSLCEGRGYGSVDDKQGEEKKEGGGEQKSLTNEMPSAEDSWLEYDQRVVPTRDRSTVKHRVLQESLGKDNGAWVIENPADQGGGGSNPQFSMERQSGREKDVVQEDTAPSHRVAYIGRALRVGYKIPRPKVEKVGTQEAKESGGTFVMQNLGEFLGATVYAAKWALLYDLEDSPNNVSYPLDRITQ